MKKKCFIVTLVVLVILMTVCTAESQNSKQPNIVFIFADQLRSQELSCYGGVNIETPNIDRLADEGLMMTNAISTYPICTPFRGMLLTGLYPLHSGISNNDHPLNPDLPSFAKACKTQGYNTAYIVKWHLDGIGRTNYIQKERRIGYDHWQALECTHDYFNSVYYENDATELSTWEGFDAEAQTKAAQQYIQSRDVEKPFFLTLSWGPPHNPYIAPQKYMDRIDAESLVFRENITENNIANCVGSNPRFVVPPKYEKRKKLRDQLTNDEWLRNVYTNYFHKVNAIDGRSLAHLVEDVENVDKTYTRSTRYWHYPFNVIYYNPYDGLPLTPHSAIMEGDYKLIFDWHGRLKLFNLFEDISETNNLAKQMPEKTNELFGKLKDWIKANVNETYWPKPNPDYQSANDVHDVPFVNLIDIYNNQNDVAKNSN